MKTHVWQCVRILPQMLMFYLRTRDIKAGYLYIVHVTALSVLFVYLRMISTYSHLDMSYIRTLSFCYVLTRS